MSTCLSPPGKCHMVLCFTKETKTMPLFLLHWSKGSWPSQGDSLLASEALKLQAAHPVQDAGKSTQMLHQQYQFFRPILHKHTFYIKEPPPFTPPFCAHHFSGIAIAICQLLPQPFRQGSTLAKYGDCNTHLAHCNYSCLLEFAFSSCCASFIGQNQ